MTLNSKILIVEDKSIVAMDLKQRLEKLGYSHPYVIADDITDSKNR